MQDLFYKKSRGKSRMRITLLLLLLIGNLSFGSADILIYSFDRPMQLYALLESIYTHVTGLNKVMVLCRCRDDKFSKAYDLVKTKFKNTIFIKQGNFPRKDFRPLMLDAAFSNSTSDYICFCVDDIIVKSKVDLEYCANKIEKHNAYGFYLRFGKNTTHEWSGQVEDGIPPSVEVEKDLFKWKFKDGEGTVSWCFPNNNDFTLYRKKDIEPQIRAIPHYNFVNTFYEAYWAGFADKEKYGLYFSQSKIINVNVNIVNLEQPSFQQFTTEWQNRIEQYNPVKLLEKFNQGIRIDIDKYNFSNNSPHQEVPLFFKKAQK